VAWGAANFGPGLSWRRYVLERLPGDTGLGGDRELGATGVALEVQSPPDGRLFHFQVFARGTRRLLASFPELRRLPTDPGCLVPRLCPIPDPDPPVDPDPVDVNVDGPAVTAQFRVDAAAPAASIAQSATHVGAGETVTFDAAGTTDPSAAGPGSGVDAASFAWSFGDGATATGRAVAHRYAIPGAYSGQLTVADRVGNTTRRAFTVRVSAVSTDGAAAATVPAGVAKTTRVSARARISGAAALRALGVGLERPTLKASWRESRLRGAVILSGRSSGALALALRLRAASVGLVDAGPLRLGDGGFRRRVTLPSGLVPGPLALEVARGPRTVARITVPIPRPPEGVARNAFITLTPGGRPATQVPGSSRALYARFALAAVPARGRALTVTWYQPNGQIAGHPVRKPSRPTFVSFVRSPADLPAGKWRAVLSAGEARIAEATARVG
jgi:hypothetical protein